MKQKGSSDVKGSLWNHLDKKVLLWHREAPLFLRVYLHKNKCNVLNVFILHCRTLLLLLRQHTCKVKDRFGGMGRFKGLLI